MWVLLIISYIGNQPHIETLQDLYSKSQCMQALKALKKELPHEFIDYRCVYIEDGN